MPAQLKTFGLIDSIFVYQWHDIAVLFDQNTEEYFTLNTNNMKQLQIQKLTGVIQILKKRKGFDQVLPIQEMLTHRRTYLNISFSIIQQPLIGLIFECLENSKKQYFLADTENDLDIIIYPIRFPKNSIVFLRKNYFDLNQQEKIQEQQKLFKSVKVSKSFQKKNHYQLLIGIDQNSGKVYLFTAFKGLSENCNDKFFNKQNQQFKENMTFLDSKRIQIYQHINPLHLMNQNEIQQIDQQQPNPKQSYQTQIQGDQEYKFKQKISKCLSSKKEVVKAFYKSDKKQSESSIPMSLNVVEKSEKYIHLYISEDIYQKEQMITEVRFTVKYIKEMMKKLLNL
eukprot:403342854